MESSAEPSSSVSFTSSSQLSNGWTVNNNVNALEDPEKTGLNHEITSLNKLSLNLGQLLCESLDNDFSDAEIVVEERTVSVHRCILAARSKFFQDLFINGRSFARKDGKPRYDLANLLPYGSIGYDAFVLFLNYLYTGKLNQSPVEVSTCVDYMCSHDVCGPAVNFAVELMYSSAIFQVPELVSLFQRRLLNLVGKATADDVIPILKVAFHCQLGQLLTRCIHQLAHSNLDTISIEKELPPAASADVRLLRLNSQPELENQPGPMGQSVLKHVKRIFRALDSDDVELVHLLLTESDTTLDDAHALHYAAAYCDPKVVAEILGFGLANVNLRNGRGHNVLHVAARRKEPCIIVSLLNKGACAADPTFEGQRAVDICRRLTRPKDYKMREKGRMENKDQMCIDLLEREMHRNPVMGGSVLPLAVADDLQMKLVYLEDRVVFAHMFFPMEAKIAMEIAHAETTTELSHLLSSKGSSGNLMEIDLNETPITQNQRLLSRIETLSRTVELGRRCFPNSSQVLDKFMDDDSSYLEKGTQEEQKTKRKRFMELKEEIDKAFNKDKAKLLRFGFSSSSTSLRDPSSYKVKKLRQN